MTQYSFYRVSAGWWFENKNVEEWEQWKHENLSRKLLIVGKTCTILNALQKQKVWIFTMTPCRSFLSKRQIPAFIAGTFGSCSVMFQTDGSTVLCFSWVGNDFFAISIYSCLDSSKIVWDITLGIINCAMCAMYFFY